MEFVCVFSFGMGAGRRPGGENSISSGMSGVRCFIPGEHSTSQDCGLRASMRTPLTAIPAPFVAPASIVALANSGCGLVTGVTVNFTVSGVNPPTGSAVTDANGRASFSYTVTAVIPARYTVAGVLPPGFPLFRMAEQRRFQHRLGWGKLPYCHPIRVVA